MTIETINEWFKYPFLLIKTWNSLFFPFCCCCCPWIPKRKKEIIGIIPRECSHGHWQILKWLLSLILENETLELPSSFFAFPLSCHPLRRNNGFFKWVGIESPTNQPFLFHFDGAYKGFFLWFPFGFDCCWFNWVLFNKREVIESSIPETPPCFHLETRQINWTGDLFSLTLDSPKNCFLIFEWKGIKGFEENKQGPRGITTMNWGDFCWFVFAMREI